MKQTIASILTLCILAAASMTSCKKDDTLLYNNITMGNIDGNTIISDQGNTFDIVDNPLSIDLTTLEYSRVILSCDVLKETADKRYDVRLTGIGPVLTKPAVKASSITEPDSELAVEDAIIINDMWYGGGYLNMLIEFAKKSDSDTKHFINLIHDDMAEGDGYTFILRHNAYGETPTQGEIYESSLGYVSFPIADIIDGDEADLTIKWKSHKMTDFGIFDPYESVDCKEECKWKRTGYEHKASAMKVMKIMRAR